MAESRCAHCGEAAPAGSPLTMIDGVECTVCCDGCAAAAQWIRAAGLDDYYRLRSAAAPRPDTSEASEDYSAWLHPDVVAEHVRPVAGGLEIQALTSAMRCAACAWLIDQSLRRIAGVIDGGANAVTGRVRIVWDPQQVALPDVLARLDALGFPLHLASGAQSEARSRKQRRTDLLRLGVAGLGAMQAMMLAEAVYLDSAGEMAIATRDFIRWFTFLVSTPVVFYAGWPFIAGLQRELRAGRLGMDTLVGGSILLAYFASLVETIRGGPEVWFDAAVMFVLLLLAARFIEQWARRQVNDQVDVLARSRPALAWRERDGSRERVAVSALKVDDRVCVAPGEVVPADGRLLTPAALDESLLTGEALPIDRAIGERVLAGSLCHGSALILQLTATGQQTYLSLLQHLVEKAQSERPALAQRADHVARFFVIGILLVATAVYWFWSQHDPTRAFPITLAVLVVSCPCALSLAIPTALAAAYSQLAARGVLTRDSNALERLAEVSAVMLDKTGTLTRGEPQISDQQIFTGWDATQMRDIAATLQQGSNHPLAHAFGRPSPSAPAARDVRTHAGVGIEGQIDQRSWRLGRADFAANRDDDGAIWLGDGQQAMARFVVGDPLRADAAQAVAALISAGLAVELSSGDGLEAVAQVAQTCGIASARARQSPQDKLERMKQRQQNDERVLMVGDGINDAPVLAGADVSFAFARGAAIAHRSADFIITSEALMRVPETIVVARQTRQVMRQNLTWAIVYNVMAIPFAAAGLVEPWLAALGMAGSSLAVSLNALRLRRVSKASQ